MKRADLGVAELLIDDFLAVWARKVDLWNDPRPVGTEERQHIWMVGHGEE